MINILISQNKRYNFILMIIIVSSLNLNISKYKQSNLDTKIIKTYQMKPVRQDHDHRALVRRIMFQY